MTKCDCCGSVLLLPQSLYYLQRRFPNLQADPTVNRSVPRCKHCEEVDVKSRVKDIDLPRSEAKAIKELEEQIVKAVTFILSGIQSEALLKVLPEMKKRLAEMKSRADPIKELEEQIKECGILILEGVQSEALLEILPVMKAELAQMKNSRILNIKALWEPFWAIWGMPENEEEIQV